MSPPKQIGPGIGSSLPIPVAPPPRRRAGGARHRRPSRRGPAATPPRDRAPGKVWRSLLVDDSPQFRRLLEGLLPRLGHGIEVVASCPDGVSALAAAASLLPDLVFLDLDMPGPSGLEVLPVLKAQDPAPRVVVVTLHDPAEYREACLLAGADGFVAKERLAAELGPLLAGLLAPDDD